MKKVYTLLLSLSVVGMLSSCGEVIEIPDVEESQGQTEQPVAPGEGLSGDVVFSATWATLADGSQPVWAGSDVIMLYDGSSVQTLTNSAEAGMVAKFPATVADGSTSFFAVTPALEGMSISGQEMTCVLPTVQTSGIVPPVAVAKSSGSQLFFCPVLSKVSFSVGFEGATKVVFKTQEKIAGDVVADYSGEQPVLTASASEVTVMGSFAKGEKYSFSIIPADISGYTAEVYVGDAVKAHITGEAFSAVAGVVTELPAFAPDIPTYRIVSMKLWGGTGPEYNCTKIYDLLKKPGCFNNEDGRGIEALKDNYMVMKDDGTFINYAGEDGRNWWFVYSGSQNPENGKDIDLRSFYDLYPLYEGKWAMKSAQEIAFTKPDGTVTTATMLPPGTYDMPGTSPTLSVTLDHMALMFQIKGGKDNWTHTWDDYGVIACRPRALFVEIEKMPDGFVVPEASMTRDDAFKYEPPVVVDFDWNSLPGKWTVYGGNASPFGIFVLGGSGSDPAFVSPIDKSWLWNDSIWRESDNGLSIAVTSMAGAEVKGTTNWWAGNDGKFWDYKWKSTDEDLSRFYNQLPKGKYEFTMNLQTLEITLGNGHKARFLGPGVNEFVYGKTLTVPDGCFALAFHLMDPIPATADHYKDVDRFVNAPLEYVIIFEKQQ